MWNLLWHSGRPRTAGSLPAKRSRSLSNPRRAHSALGTTDRLIHEVKTDPGFAESIIQCYRYILEKYARPKLGLQQYRIKDPPNRRLKHSGIYQNPSLTRGQKLYLLEKCHVNKIIRHLISINFMKIFRFMMWKKQRHGIKMLMHKF